LGAWENPHAVTSDFRAARIHGAGVLFTLDDQMIYRPSPRLVAANAALVHFLTRRDAARATEEAGQREEELGDALRGQAGHDGTTGPAQGGPDRRDRQTGDKEK
jgi:hypothetical protein